MKFIELSKKVDPRSGQVIEDKPQFIKKNDAAIVKLAPIKKMCMEKYKDFQELGRLAVRDMVEPLQLASYLISLEDKANHNNKPLKDWY
jgi:translation elongation factor EF-1alpha